MTPIDLQNELCEEIRRILDGYEYRNAKGEYMPINIFPQNIPITESDEDIDPIPYVIVRLNSGDDDGKRIVSM